MLNKSRKLLSQKFSLSELIETWKSCLKMSADGAPGTDSNKRTHESDDVESNASKKLCLADDLEEKEKKFKSKKLALLLSYNGKNYKGMQINMEYKTIESELITALSLSGVIKVYDRDDLYFIRFQRAARTDKSVSAAQQVVSFLARNIEFRIEDINRHLPADIRVFSVVRATKSFDSWKYCCARTYSYLLPTQVLSKEPMSTFSEIDYRITPEIIQQTKDLLKMYVGTHRFHNFTKRKTWSDPSCKRYIMSFSCGEPFVHVKEFMLLTVKGQSFMLNQIRKLVGAVIAIQRGLKEPGFIEEALTNPSVRVPTAPGAGLLLEQVHYDHYNSKYGKDGIHESLDWKNVEEEVAEFRKKNIIIPIIEDELKNKTMCNWVEENLEDVFLKKETEEEEETEEKETEEEETEEKETEEEETEEKETEEEETEEKETEEKIDKEEERRESLQ